MRKDIVILGSSGFAKEVLWLLEDDNSVENQWNILGFVDNSPAKSIIAGYSIIGNDAWLMNYSHPICAVCAFGSPSIRRRVAETYKRGNNNVSFPSIISKRASISKYTELDEGCVICAGTQITTDIQLGKFVIVNLNCTIGHDTVIGDYTTINPGSNISGNVLIGNDCEIGTGARIIQGKHIGPKSIIGAGSVIIRDVPGNCTVVGNPGRILEK